QKAVYLPAQLAGLRFELTQLVGVAGKLTLDRLHRLFDDVADRLGGQNLLLDGSDHGGVQRVHPRAVGVAADHRAPRTVVWASVPVRSVALLAPVVAVQNGDCPAALALPHAGKQVAMEAWTAPPSTAVSDVRGFNLL